MCLGRAVQMKVEALEARVRELDAARRKAERLRAKAEEGGRTLAGQMHALQLEKSSLLVHCSLTSLIRLSEIKGSP